MNRHGLRITNLVMCFVLLLSALMMAGPNPLSAAPEQAATAPQVATSACRYGSLVWADGNSYGIRIWRQYLQFNWCYNGSYVTVLGTPNQWIEVYYPNTQVAWKTTNVSPGANGSKIIEARAELKFCLFGYLCLNKYSTIKLQLLRDGRVIRLG